MFIIFLLYFISLGKSDVEPLVRCQTTQGPLLIQVHPAWAPLGAERFLTLVRDDFYRDIAFYRCVKRFLTQFGISDRPEKAHWHYNQIKDDPNLNLGIKKHYVSFAGGGPNTRSTQIFIAFEDLDFLGKEPWETPFGEVIEGGDTLTKLYKEYGDIAPFGKGPNQGKLFNKGNAYIREEFPNIDFLQECSEVVSEKLIERDLENKEEDKAVAAEGQSRAEDIESVVENDKSLENKSVALMEDAPRLRSSDLRSRLRIRGAADRIFPVYVVFLIAVGVLLMGFYRKVLLASVNSVSASNDKKI